MRVGKIIRLGVAVAMVLAAICVVCLFVWRPYIGRDGVKGLFQAAADPSAEEYPLRGIDISAHNGELDTTALDPAKLHFIYIKATEGTDFIDRNFARNAALLCGSAIPVGAYHFFRFDTDGEMQALNFLKALRGRDFRLPPVIDLEEWGNPKGYSTAHITGELRRMLATLALSGVKPMLYTNKDGYYRFVDGRFTDLPLWISSFTDPPLGARDANWEVWQYTHRGSHPAVQGAVDFNTVNPGSAFAEMLRQ